MNALAFDLTDAIDLGSIQTLADQAVPTNLPTADCGLMQSNLVRAARQHRDGFLTPLDDVLAHTQSCFKAVIIDRRRYHRDPPAQLAKVFAPVDRLFATVYFAGENRWILLPLDARLT